MFGALSFIRMGWCLSLILMVHLVLFPPQIVCGRKLLVLFSVKQVARIKRTTVLLFLVHVVLVLLLPGENFETFKWKFCWNSLFKNDFSKEIHFRKELNDSFFFSTIRQNFLPEKDNRRKTFPKKHNRRKTFPKKLHRRKTLPKSLQWETFLRKMRLRIWNINFRRNHFDSLKWRCVNNY